MESVPTDAQVDTKSTLDPQEVDRQIKLASDMLGSFSARSIGEVITGAMGKYDDDPDKVAQSLVDQNVFQKTTDCTDPLGVAKEVVKRYQLYGEGLREEEKPL